MTYFILFTIVSLTTLAYSLWNERKDRVRTQDNQRWIIAELNKKQRQRAEQVDERINATASNSVKRDSATNERLHQLAQDYQQALDRLTRINSTFADGLLDQAIEHDGKAFKVVFHGGKSVTDREGV